MKSSGVVFGVAFPDYDVVEVLQFMRVGILEGWADNRLGEGVANRLLDDQRRWQVTNVRGVVLDLALTWYVTVDLNVRVEATLVDRFPSRMAT